MCEDVDEALLAAWEEADLAAELAAEDAELAAEVTELSWEDKLVAALPEAVLAALPMLLAWEESESARELAPVWMAVAALLTSAPAVEAHERTLEPALVAQVDASPAALVAQVEAAAPASVAQVEASERKPSTLVLMSSPRSGLAWEESSQVSDLTGFGRDWDLVGIYLDRGGHGDEGNVGELHFDGFV